MYPSASSGGIQSANTDLKNRTPSAAMVKGLISQLTTRVIRRPRGCSATRFRLEKSTAIIIG